KRKARDSSRFRVQGFTVQSSRPRSRAAVSAYGRTWGPPLGGPRPNGTARADPRPGVDDPTRSATAASAADPPSPLQLSPRSRCGRDAGTGTRPDTFVADVGVPADRCSADAPWGILSRA